MIKPIFIENFLPPELNNFIYNYCIIKYSSPGTWKIDPSTSSIVSQYADPVMETILDMSTPVIEQNVGKKLWPTNSFFRIYDKGSDLKVHTDRSSCEYTVALCIGCSPHNKPYEIFIGEEDETSDYKFFNEENKYKRYKIEYKFPMVGNNALIFQGINKFHWREYCQHDHFITVFLHYVDQQGEYAHLKYDGREMLATCRK